MGRERLVVDSEGRVRCPRRGEIDSEWCLGCANRTDTLVEGDKTTIVCSPGEVAIAPSAEPGPLSDLPDMWRTY